MNTTLTNICKQLIFLFLFSLVFPINLSSQNICGSGATTLCQTVAPIPGNNVDPVQIRIYVHVIRDSNKEGGQTHQQVLEAMKILDDAFNPQNIFFLWDCNTFYIDDDGLASGSGEQSVFTGNPFGNNNHSDGIDIYLFPENNQWIGQTNLDFFDDCKRFGTELLVGGKFDEFPFANYATSHLLSHEMGHCLGLLHTFDNPSTQIVNLEDNDLNCNNSLFTPNGDGICDTPADPGMDFKVPPSCNWGFECDDKDSFDDPFNPDETNIMGYSSSECYSGFTPGQGLRMRNIIATESVLQNCVVPIPTIDFENYPFQSSTNIPAGEYLLDGEITIESGVTLTIMPHAVLTFTEGSKLIVKQNARLELYGTLTAPCRKTWKGVEVWSTPDQSQGFDFSLNQYHQGFVRTYGRSIIENAEVGIQLFETGSEFGGGILRAHKTAFINNKVGVKTAAYANFWSAPFGPPSWQGQPRPYDASLSECSFITDSAYPHEENDFTFISLTQVNGIRISGCSFSNVRKIDLCAEITDYGIGILNSSAGFSVTSLCEEPIPNAPCSNPIRTTFFGLGYGVTSNGFGSNLTYYIRESDFENCHVGILNGEVHLSTIIHNRFFMGELENNLCPNFDNDFGHQVAIHLAGPINGITLQENQFVDSDISDITTIGISVLDILDFNNAIRRNTFDGLDYANLVNGYCGGSQGGLHFLCNTMTNGKLYDIAAITEGISNALIRTNQGEFDSDIGTYGAAGNSFSHTLPQPAPPPPPAPPILGDNSDFRSDTPINYYYFDQGQEEPKDVLNVTLFERLAPNNCEIEFNLEFPPIYDLDEVKSDFYTDKSDYNQAKSDYEDAILIGDASLTEQKLFEMGIAQIGMDKKAQIILKELISDTLTYSKDSINTWWANVDRYGTDLALAQNYLNDNQFNDALVLLNNAYTKYNLSTEQTNDLNVVISIYQLLQQKTLDGLDENDLDNLKVLADDIYTVGSATLAKSILQYHGVKLFPPVYFLPTENDNARLISEEEEKVPFKLFVQPNPADDYIEFRWNKLPESPSIRIFNAVGKLMWEGNLSDKIDYFHLNTDFLQSGIYFYQLYSNGKPTYLKAGKLIIQKR